LPDSPSREFSTRRVEQQNTPDVPVVHLFERRTNEADKAELIDLEARRLGRWSLGAILVGVVASVIYLNRLDSDARELILGSFALPWLIAAGLGVVLQGAAWIQLLRTGIRKTWLTIATVGCLLSLTGVSVVREAIRLSHIDITQLYANHAAAREIGGFVVFLLFAIINFGVIGYCVWLVRRGLHRSGEPESVS
jgi:hypothetical protein